MSGVRVPPPASSLHGQIRAVEPKTRGIAVGASGPNEPPQTPHGLTKLIALVAPASVAASTGATTAAADERRCGDMGASAPDYYDVRARNVKCLRARRTVRRWIRAMSGSVFDTVEVGNLTCKGRRSSRRIDGVKTFRIRCADGGRVVRCGYARSTDVCAARGTLSRTAGSGRSHNSRSSTLASSEARGRVLLVPRRRSTVDRGRAAPIRLYEGGRAVKCAMASLSVLVRAKPVVEGGRNRRVPARSPGGGPVGPSAGGA